MNDGDTKWSQINFDGNTSGKTKLIWSGLCISSPSQLHQLEAQHFDEHYKRKQSESFVSKPEHTIWVSRHRTLRMQYLHFGVFLWNQYKVLPRCNKYASWKIFVYVFLYSHQHSISFKAPTYWNCHLHKGLSTDDVFQWW